MAHRFPWSSFTFGLQAGLLAHAGERSSACSLVKTLWGGSHLCSPTGMTISHHSQICKLIQKAHFAFGKNDLKGGGGVGILKLVVQGDGDGIIECQAVYLFPFLW